MQLTTDLVKTAARPSGSASPSDLAPFYQVGQAWRCVPERGVGVGTRSGDRLRLKKSVACSTLAIARARISSPHVESFTTARNGRSSSMAEHRFRKAGVVGSTPIFGSSRTKKGCHTPRNCLDDLPLTVLVLARFKWWRCSGFFRTSSAMFQWRSTASFPAV